MSRGRKLSVLEIDDIRARAAEGISDVVIADSFGINRATVARYTADVVRPRKPVGVAVAEALDEAVDERLLERARALSPVDRLELSAREDFAARVRALAAAGKSVTAIEIDTGRDRRTITAILGRAPTVREQIAQDALAGWAPLCMEAEDWTHWQKTNPTSAGDAAARPCTDCPLGFAAEMRAIGKCNGTPGCSYFLAKPKEKRKLSLTEEERQRRGDRLRQINAERAATKAS